MTRKKNPVLGIEDVILDSLEEVDMSDLNLPLIAVFEHPRDYPEKIVARIFDGERPSNTILLKDKITDMMAELATTSMVWMPPHKDDPSNLIGWMI